ncbi:MAG: 2,3-bisphosphoglycerate-independent phosphoglycerate mutase [Candidatus Bathyarchaeia archaeon]|nr:2,3-bisphosphoglycerate-independent phosphoglycerate mutase [Candidatus Bathyarchaeota archaeon]
MASFKGILFICDGMGDRPNPVKGGRSPLEEAFTPNMDRLASGGLVGLMDIVSPGVRPGSDVAHLSLFGYDPYRYYTGRGGFEAAGAGLHLKPGDVALRCNYATVDGDLVIQDRRAGRIKEGGKKLAEALNSIQLDAEDVKVEYYHTVEHRGVLVLRSEGKKLSTRISDTDPHLIGVKVLEAEPLDDSEEARFTAKLLNEFTSRSYEILKDHPVNVERIKRGLPPANIVLSRGAGSLPQVEPLDKIYHCKFAAIAAVALVKGICRVVGMDVIEVPGATGGLDTNYSAKGRAALEALEDYDFVVIHIKAADVAAHDGDFDLKVEVIQNIDRTVGEVVESVNLDSTYIALTADHATPVSIRDHMGDPVPFFIHGPGLFPSGIGKFCERSASRGNASRIRGLDLMPLLMNYTGRSEKFGF